MPSLYPDTYTLSESTGGTVNFTLDNSPDFGSNGYHLLGSLSGYDPGTDIPYGPHLPLNWDSFTDLIIKLVPILPGFHSSFDSAGRSTARFNTGGPLPPGTAPLTIYWAYLVYDPATSALLDASNFCFTEIVP